MSDSPGTGLTAQQIVLYQQIHPAKLAVDWGVTPLALYLFWIHSLLWALIVSFVPSIVASLIVVLLADIAKYRESGFGRYVKRYMTRTMQAVRFAGFCLMAVGAWLNWWWLIPVGVVVVLFGWLRGLILPGSSCKTSSDRGRQSRR